MFPRQFRYMVDGAWVLGTVVFAGAVLLALASIRRRRDGPAPPPENCSKLRRQFHVLVEDLGLISHSKYLPLSFFQSLPYLLLQVIPIWAAFHGYGFDLGWTPAFVLMVVLRLSSAVPQAPGNLGFFMLPDARNVWSACSTWCPPKPRDSRWCCGGL